MTRDKAGFLVNTLVVQLTVITTIFGIGYLVFAMVLRRRRKWARAMLSGLAALHLLWSMLLVGRSPASIVVAVLISVGVVLIWRPGATQWLKEG